MIEGNSRYHGNERGLDDVRGVKSSAHTDLKNYNVAIFPLEILKGDSGDQLKLRGLILHRIGKGTDVFGYFGKHFV